MGQLVGWPIEHLREGRRRLALVSRAGHNPHADARLHWLLSNTHLLPCLVGMDFIRLPDHVHHD